MSDTELIKSVTTHEFLEKAAAKEPTPGGGGIAALSGALAASMLEMALNFTVGNRKYAAVDEKARALVGEVRGARLRLESLVAADARGYGAVAAALKMPRSTADEKNARKVALQGAMKQALEPPLEALRTARILAALVPSILEVGNPNLSGDMAVAAALLPGAARSATLNIWANVSALTAEKRAELVGEIKTALAEIDGNCSPVYAKVEERLCPENAQGRS
ncbi:MAG: cyclodeaminase/cyclohydrolase family protein [Planctomycetota bacterium]|jgi:formiminotetrahydrofolate cyclodeaminase